MGDQIIYINTQLIRSLKHENFCLSFEAPIVEFQSRIISCMEKIWVNETKVSNSQNNCGKNHNLICEEK